MFEYLGAHSDLVGAGSGEDKMDATGNKVLHKEAKNNVTGKGTGMITIAVECLY